MFLKFSCGLDETLQHDELIYRWSGLKMSSSCQHYHLLLRLQTAPLFGVALGTVTVLSVCYHYHWYMLSRGPVAYKGNLCVIFTAESEREIKTVSCSDITLSFLSTGYPGFQTATYTSRSYAGITPGYTYQFPGNHSTLCVQLTVALTEK